MPQEAVLAVMTRVVEGDNEFQARLFYDPVQALKQYALTSEEHTALASGDMAKVVHGQDAGLNKRIGAYSLAIER